MTLPSSLKPTEVFDTYLRFACERQRMFMKRVRGESAPWTSDPVLAAHRFTNPYRASDRVSQYLIRMQYDGPQDADNLFWRTMLFKMFNRVDTWELVKRTIGEPSFAPGVSAKIADAFDAARASGQSVYTSAYMMPEPKLGQPSKHRNHLMMLDQMMADGMPAKCAASRNLEALYKLLLVYGSIGPFLAFQYAIDLNYSTLCDHDEMSFVVAGPGARSGVEKCFGPKLPFSHEYIIRCVALNLKSECDRLGLTFETLYGRPPQLIDCQNLACETDKVSRILHPDAKGNGRTEIKAKYNPQCALPIPQWYPPKWGLVVDGKCADCGEAGAIGACGICGAIIK